MAIKTKMLGLDPRAIQNMKDSILAEVRKMIDAKFQGGTDALDADAKTAVVQLNVALIALKNDVQLLSARQDTSESSIGLVQNQLRLVKDTAEDPKLSNEVKTVKSDLERLNKRVTEDTTPQVAKQSQDSIVKLANRIDAIEAAVLSIKKTGVNGSSVNQAATNQAFAAFQDDLSRFNLAITGMREEITRMKSTISGVSMFDDSALRSRMDSLEDDISRLSGFSGSSTANPIELNKITTRIDSVTNVVGVVQSQISDLKIAVDGVKSLTATLTPFDSSKIEGRLSVLESSKAGQTAPSNPTAQVQTNVLGGTQAYDAAVVNTRLDQIEAQLKVLASSTDILKTGLTDLGKLHLARLDNADAQSAGLSSKLDGFVVRLDNIDSKLKSVSDASTGLQQGLTALAGAAAARTELTDLSNRISTLEVKSGSSSVPIAQIPSGVAAVAQNAPVVQPAQIPQTPAIPNQLGNPIVQPTNAIQTQPLPTTVTQTQAQPPIVGQPNPPQPELVVAPNLNAAFPPPAGIFGQNMFGSYTALN